MLDRTRRWFFGKSQKPNEATAEPEPNDPGGELTSLSIRVAKDSVTINGLDPDWVEYVKKLADAEGDPPSVFMRKRLLEGLGAYLAGKNRNAWKAYKAIGEARENF